MQSELEYEIEITELNAEDNEEIVPYPNTDVCTVRRIWLETKKGNTSGFKWSIIPVVKAAKEEIPPKPPKMRFKDLPLYKTPHYDYKDYLVDKELNQCPKRHCKLAHEYLLPKVQDTKASWFKKYCELKCDTDEMRDEIKANYYCRKDQFIRYMRDPENFNIRVATMVAGGAMGAYLGSGSHIPRRSNIPKRFMFTGLGVLAAGALCFPKETDEAFRTVCYNAAKLPVAFFNLFCHRNYSLRETGPCKKCIPPPPPCRPQTKCEKKKIEEDKQKAKMKK